MTVTTTVALAHEELREDHRRLHALVDRLRAAADDDALAAVFDELYSALTAHFNAEEKPGGLYDALGVCVPELRAQLSELVDDHFRIAAALRELRDRARPGPGRTRGALPEDAARLARALAEHERLEHAMVDAAILRGA
jgi:malate synthase